MTGAKRALADDAAAGTPKQAKTSKGARIVKAEPGTEDSIKETAKVKLVMATVFERAYRLVREIPRLDEYKFARIL